MRGKIKELRGTASSWHAESGGVIFLITLSLPSLMGVFEVKKKKENSNEMKKFANVIKLVQNCDPFKVSHVCICVFRILDVRNSLQYRALKKYCLVNECATERLPFLLVATPALKRILKWMFFVFFCFFCCFFPALIENHLLSLSGSFTASVQAAAVRCMQNRETTWHLSL